MGLHCVAALVGRHFGTNRRTLRAIIIVNEYGSACNQSRDKRDYAITS